MGYCPCGGAVGRVCRSGSTLEPFSVHDQLHDCETAGEARHSTLCLDRQKSLPDRIWSHASCTSGAVLDRLRTTRAKGSIPGLGWRVGNQIIGGLALSELSPFATLAEFSRRSPHVHFKLRQLALIAPDVEFSAHNAHLCISGIVSREYFVHPIAEVRMIAVARWDHPLHQLKRQVARADMLGHTLVNIEGASNGSTRRQPLAATQRHLAVGSIEAAVDAVRCGFCFGWLPAYGIKTALNSGEIIPLRMSTGSERQVRLNLICTDPTTSGQ